MEVRLPNLGEDADRATVASVFVKEGDTIEKDQALIEIESEKAVASVPSTTAGTVQKIHVKEGDEISVGALIATIDGGGGDDGQPETPKTDDTPDDGPRPAPERAPKTREEFELPEGAEAVAPPSIRKVARNLGIDLSRVSPTGRGGRILLEDVREYIQGLQQQSLQRGPGSQPVETESPAVDFSRWGPVDVKKASSLRRTIAARMTESWTTIPHVNQFADADITGLMGLRKKHIEAYAEREVKLTLTPILIQALCTVLQKHPLINSSWDDRGNVVGKEYIHIGLAIDTEAGLLVPVIRHADKKSVLELALEIETLAEAARGRNLSKEQMQGGTFTVSNQGGIGGAHFTPIINKPEAAILGLGRGREVVRMIDGQPQARILLPVTVAHDHRVIDGADGVRFLVDLVGAFERFPESDIEIAQSKG